jgi:hypothetical protein
MAPGDKKVTQFNWRRLVQLRLRSLLVLVFVVACLASRYGLPVWQWAFPPSPDPKAVRLPVNLWALTPEEEITGQAFRLPRENMNKWMPPLRQSPLDVLGPVYVSPQLNQIEQGMKADEWLMWKTKMAGN